MFVYKSDDQKGKEEVIMRSTYCMKQQEREIEEKKSSSDTKMTRKEKKANLFVCSSIKRNKLYFDKEEGQVVI